MSKRHHVQPSQDLRAPPARGPRAHTTAASTPRASSSSSASGARPPRPTRSGSSIRAVRASASRSATDRWPSTRAPALEPSPCPRRPRIAEAPDASSAGAVRGALRAGRRTNRLGLVLGAIVVAFMLAFFSLAQQVRVSATGLDIGRLELERQRLEDTASDLRSDLNRLGREPADPQAGASTRVSGSCPSRSSCRPARRSSDRCWAEPIRAAACSSCWSSSSSARWRSSARLAYWQVVDRERLACEALRPDDGHASRRRASAATSTTGPARSSSPRPSSASGSSPRRTS